MKPQVECLAPQLKAKEFPEKNLNSEKILYEVFNFENNTRRCHEKQKIPNEKENNKKTFPFGVSS
jgi:hypothetical protein